MRAGFLTVSCALLLWLSVHARGEASDGSWSGGPLPYDEGADAAAAVEAALLAARRSSRLVLLNFGANWCADCRAFARAMADPALSGVIDDDFVTVKIDVGNWDRNPDVVDEWGNPIAEGIPALVIVSPAREVLFSTRRGQVSNASRMNREELAAFFHLLAEAAQARRNTAAPER